ncbi:C-X-C chemokine receptor type 2 [Tetranychus urticae]|uniref:G-protein coupled receptors family 1 profile domain-containing protein n=1 Tax=Tetranychus urticae TaxID=32264 RepID=T1JU77_TETUR|nr:C-X-C chemokine receptor type 2 [Tetranychus urticae]
MAFGFVEACEVIYAFICVLGFVFNFMVIYVIFCCISSKSRSRLTSRTILSLALCDLLATLNLPFFIASMSNGWSFSSSLCKLFTFTLILEQFAKTFLLSLLGLTSVAQYRGSVYNLTTAKITILLGSIWTSSFVLALTFASLTSPNLNCDLFLSYDFAFKETFTFTYTICVLFLPIMILSLLLHQSRSEPFEPTESVIELFELTIGLLSVHITLSLGHVIGTWITTFSKVPPGIPEPAWKVQWIMVSGIIWCSLRFVFPIIYTYFWTEFRKGLIAIFTDSLEYRPMARYENSKGPL